MTLHAPRTTPASYSTHQSLEDSHWRPKQVNGNGNANGHPPQGLRSKVNEFLLETKDLPMYKDKPNYPGRRKSGFLQANRKSKLLALALTAFVFWYYMLRSPQHDSQQNGSSRKWLSTPGSAQKVDWNVRREAVRDAFITSWGGYEKYAWGMDEYFPVSKQGKNMVPGGMGWIIVDSLDTAIMMNLTSQVKHAREWMKTSLHFNADAEVNTFETTIRILGGLLSAHYISTTHPQLAPQRDDDTNQPGEDLYLELATDLADRLMGAFDTQTGIPMSSVNLNTSQGRTSRNDAGASSTAEAGTLQLEFKYLSKLTGEPFYWKKAENILEVFEANLKPDGLLPIHISPVTGEFRGDNIRLGSRGDSYYKYLIKQYLQTEQAEPVYLSMWNEAFDGMKKHLITYTKNAQLTVLAERQSGLKRPMTPKMDHLVCFLPGAIALSLTGGSTIAETKARRGSAWSSKSDEDLRLAEELTKTCWAMYKATKTGLAPEIAYFIVDDPPKVWTQGPSFSGPFDPELDLSEDADWRLDIDIHAQDTHNLQRPELVESLFYMWRITRNPIYREWGWEMFQSFMEHTSVKDSNGEISGFTSLGDITQVPAGRKRRDNMESFWLSETLKYFWLLFGPEDEWDLEKVVINTEAHFFPRFELGRVWKTGWERRNPRFGGKHDHEHEEGEEHGHIEENGVPHAGEVKREKKVDVEGSLDGLGVPVEID